MSPDTLPTSVQHLLDSLLHGGLVYTRKEAAEKLAQLDDSDVRIVAALLATSEMDSSPDVRRAAAQALSTAPHQTIFAKYRDLAEDQAANHLREKVQEFRSASTKAYKVRTLTGSRSDLVFVLPASGTARPTARRVISHEPPRPSTHGACQGKTRSLPYADQLHAGICSAAP